MKNLKSISQLKQFKILSTVTTKINGGEKKESAGAREEIE